MYVEIQDMVPIKPKIQVVTLATFINTDLVCQMQGKKRKVRYKVVK